MIENDKKNWSTLTVAIPNEVTWFIEFVIQSYSWVKFNGDFEVKIFQMTESIYANLNQTG